MFRESIYTQITAAEVIQYYAYTIQACARMGPNGITDLELKSFMKKFREKSHHCERCTERADIT